MDFLSLFIPYETPQNATTETLQAHTQYLTKEHYNWLDAGIFLLGFSQEKDNYSTVNAIRSQLYKLSLPHENTKIHDLGNLIPRENTQATSELLGFVINELVSKGKIVIVLAESREVAYSQALAYRYFGNKELEDNSEASAVYLSSALDMKEHAKESSESVNYRILNTYPPLYQVLTALGVQKYRLSKSEIDLMHNFNFPLVRYGEIHNRVQEVEPYLRETNAVCLDMSCVRHSDSPASARPSPSGFTAMEICQIGRYIGASAHISSFCLTEIQEKEDIHGQSCLLSAMVIWYFLEGIYHKKTEIPSFENKTFRRFDVKINAGIEQLVFLQSMLTQRWWMEVRNEHQTCFVPCSEKSYEAALLDEIPDLWWQVYYRLGG